MNTEMMGLRMQSVCMVTGKNRAASCVLYLCRDAAYTVLCN